MKYTRGQFTQEYYQLWRMGLLLPVPKLASVFSVKYRKNHFDEYSKVTLKAVSVSDALERACYAITYASPWRPEDIDLHAVYDEEENLLWIDEPFYEVVQKKNEFRGMARREFIAKFGMTTAAILFGLRPLKALGGTSVTLGGTASGFVAPPGERLYTSAGSFNWTVPNGVTSVCVVCIGGGGCGSGDNSSSYHAGGGGGGLRYSNAISVTPSTTISIAVGIGANRTGTNTGVAGGVSSFGASLSAGGGSGGTCNNTASNLGGGGGGTGTGGSGGDGGRGGDRSWQGNVHAGGGGGAAGYTGNGGRGADQTTGSVAQAGLGGGGGGGTDHGYGGAAGGGGVGLYGLGSSGSGGSGGGGGGGSGGSNGQNAGSSGYNGGNGGAYGGGGGGGYNHNNGVAGNGGGGAVRIIWGPGRSFPSNAT